MASNESETKYMKVGFASPGVLHIQFDYGPKNLISEPFWREYGSIFDRLPTYGDVRCVVVSSKQEGYFTGGLDVAAAGGSLSPKDPDGARRAFYFRDLIRNFQAAFSAPERCGVPVICAIHGVAVGLAIDLASACDIRLMASDSKCTIKEIDIGIAADTGTLARVPKIIGSLSQFAELALTAREFGADEATRLGFASRTVQGSRDEVVKEALSVASVIASKSPVASASTKRLILHARDHSVESALEYTQVWNAAMIQTDDVKAAIEGYVTGKEPTFKPLRNAKA